MHPMQVIPHLPILRVHEDLTVRIVGDEVNFPCPVVMEKLDSGTLNQSLPPAIGLRWRKWSQVLGLHIFLSKGESYR